MKEISTILSRPHTAEVIDRLVRYARIETTSDRHSESVPSTASQWDLARLLVSELQALGIQDVSIDDKCYVIARIPGSPGHEHRPAIGFMAHLDTSSDVCGKHVNPQVIAAYDGRSISLSSNWTLDPAEFPDLLDYQGDTLIVTDGTTLLGADDKAGIAIIMTAVNAILHDPAIVHGPFYAIFSPDEEVGKGMDNFPMHRFQGAACYTLDGGKGGEVESECFNAYSASVSFTGKASHPGYARGVMANAVAMAGTFIAMLPRSESPEATDGWYGYYYAHEIHGGLEAARVEVLLRDFSDAGMERRIATIKTLAAAVEAQFPGGTVNIDLKKQYLNMKKKLDQNARVLDLLYEAARLAGAEPYSKPIRGGTDGARLTEMGIPTPNIFAGMHNFHGRHEWASAAEMVLAVDTLLELAKLWAND